MYIMYHVFRIKHVYCIANDDQTGQISGYQSVSFDSLHVPRLLINELSLCKTDNVCFFVLANNLIQKLREVCRVKLVSVES